MNTASRQDAVTRAQGWALALASVASFMVVLDLLVVATALNTIRRDLGASIGQLEWTVNAYTLAFAVLLMTAAAVGDRFGRRRVFAIGLGVFAAGSAACALAPGAGALIAARTVQGVGAAMVMPLALALLNAAVPPQRRGWAMGIFGSVTALAVVVGPVLGGAITQGVAWQWIFWLNVPVGLLTIPLALRHLDESYGPRAALDLPGVVLGTGAALGLVWGLVRGSSAGWASPEAAGRAHGGRGAGRGVHRLGTACPRADAADALVRHPGLLRGQRGGLPHERVDHRGGLLHGPVPAGRPRPGSARRRAAAAALGRGAVPDRTAGGEAGRPDRRAAAGRLRVAAAGRRVRLDRRHRRPRAGLPGDARADDDLRRRARPVRARGHQGRGRLGPARRHRQGVGQLQHDAPAGRRVRRRDPGRRVRHGWRLHLGRRVQRRVRARHRGRDRPGPGRGPRRAGPAGPARPGTGRAGRAGGSEQHAQLIAGGFTHPGRRPRRCPASCPTGCRWATAASPRASPATPPAARRAADRSAGRCG